jgi:hypothetical protein
MTLAERMDSQRDAWTVSRAFEESYGRAMGDGHPGRHRPRWRRPG